MSLSKRGFLSALTGMVAVLPWRVGWSETPPRGAHDTSSSTATATNEHQESGAPIEKPIRGITGHSTSSTAHCLERNSPRTFRLDRITI